MSTPIDLSRLPPDVRRIVEAQLAKLPPQAREKLLREGSPILDRIIAKVQGAVPPPLPSAGQVRHTAATAAREAVAQGAENARAAAFQIERLRPQGHYNATIRPGDSPGAGRWLLVVFFAALAAVLLN